MISHCYIYMFTIFTLCLNLNVSGITYDFPDQNQQPKSNQIAEYRNRLDAANNIYQLKPKLALELVEEVLVFSLGKEKQFLLLMQKDDSKNDSIHIIKHLQAEAYSVLGDINLKQKFYDVALQNFYSALDIYNDIEEKEDEKILYKKTGEAHKKQKEYAKSIDQYEEYHNYVIDRKKNKDNIDVKNILAELYFIVGHVQKAEELHNDALELARTHKWFDKELETISLLGAMAERKEENEEAIVYYKKAQEIANSFGDVAAVNKEYRNLVRVYKRTNNSLALKNLEEVIKLNVENDNFNQLTQNQIELANTFRELNNTQKAISTLKESVFLAQKNEAYHKLSTSLLALSELYEEIEKPKLALEAFKAYSVAQDTIENRFVRSLLQKEDYGSELQEVQEKLKFLERDRNLDLKTIEILEAEKNFQEKELIRKSKERWYLLSGLLVFVITTLLFIKINRSRKRANKLLHLKSLRSQMNPHFIFNSLNSVNNFISKNDERAANKFISDFSKLMRRVLEYSQEELIALELEFEIIELYLKLEHARFKEKFDFQISIDQNVDLSSVFIPPMLLQPFIENAIWHGLRYKETKGVLEVKLTDCPKYYLITVTDDGIGRKKSSELKTNHQKAHKSTALKNIETRLEHIRSLYKTKLDVKILDGDHNIGTVVQLKIMK